MIKDHKCLEEKWIIIIKIIMFNRAQRYVEHEYQIRIAQQSTYSNLKVWWDIIKIIMLIIT